MDKQEEQQTSQPLADPTRRRLAQAGLAAPVVLATLASKNALAATPYNCTVSGMLSGNTSSHGAPVPCTSLGVSPGCWKSPHVCGTVSSYNDTRWPSPYKPTTPFTTAFSSYPTGYNTKTMLDALRARGGGNIAFARAAIASLLNSLKFAPELPLEPPAGQSPFQCDLQWRDDHPVDRVPRHYRDHCVEHGRRKEIFREFVRHIGSVPRGNAMR